MRRGRPTDHRQTEFTEANARQVADLYHNIARGDTREAKLRACSMWYAPEFTAAVQRHIEGRRTHGS